MKTYYIMVAKSFMKGHPRAGDKTFFDLKLMLAEHNRPGSPCQMTIIEEKVHNEIWYPKIHTVRENYWYWEKVVGEINKGKAQLSLRQWSGVPYKSPQEEFMLFGAGQVGVQKVKTWWTGGRAPESKQEKRSPEDFEKQFHILVDDKIRPEVRTFALNDGLSERDFLDWFDKDFEGCILHFSDLRYK